MFFKTKELCHLESKMPDQMPFEFLRYLIYFSRNEEKSENVSLYVRHVKPSYLISKYAVNLFVQYQVGP